LGEARRAGVHPAALAGRLGRGREAAAGRHRLALADRLGGLVADVGVVARLGIRIEEDQVRAGRPAGAIDDLAGLVADLDVVLDAGAGGAVGRDARDQLVVARRHLDAGELVLAGGAVEQRDGPVRAGRHEGGHVDRLAGRRLVDDHVLEAVDGGGRLRRLALALAARGAGLAGLAASGRAAEQSLLLDLALERLDARLGAAAVAVGLRRVLEVL